MNSNSDKLILSSRNMNKENCIVIEDYDDTFNGSIPTKIQNENSLPVPRDDELSLGFLGSSSYKKGIKSSKSMQEPMLKAIRLSQSPARSNIDSGIL